MNDEDLYEKAWEAVQEDPLWYLMDSKKSTEEFLDWADLNHKEAFQAMLNEWLQTAEGQAFFEMVVSKLMDNRPEPDREQNPFEDR